MTIAVSYELLALWPGPKRGPRGTVLRYGLSGIASGMRRNVRSFSSAICWDGKKWPLGNLPRHEQIRCL
jgi:hypothetical protein